MLSALLSLIYEPHAANAHVFTNHAHASAKNAHVFSKVAKNWLEEGFSSPPDSARPWVYWYFMEGQMTREGMTADLESMKRSGLGGGIFLEVNIGIPRGPVLYMSPQWRWLVDFGIRESDRLGLGFDLGTGPGWCGSGGPWVTPDQAMQHLVSSRTDVSGPAHFSNKLAQPKPHDPWFGVGTLTPKLKEEWESYYRDEVVLALPTIDGLIADLEDKSLIYRPQFSSLPGVKPFLEFDKRDLPGSDISKVQDITRYMRPDGTLTWDVPAGKWTILRFGRTLTGQTTRPAPEAGLGFETDKFEKTGIDAHLHVFVDSLIAGAGERHPGRGLTSLHWDSWEMNSQNWSPHFRELFRKHRGYDPTPYLPAMAGMIVGSTQISERFLWDLRQTAQELVIENHMGEIRKKARANGLSVSVEPYDQNPTSDLELGATADEPMCEFWSKGYGFSAEFSCFEAVSVAHTNGKPIVGAEAFTASDEEAWKQYPGSMKAQTDWALATGINKFYFHRYQHQPTLNELPGMTMGPYGVHWERTETWWDMVPAYHQYLARCQGMLRQGLPVADILYLVPEGAPNVFQPPTSATIGDLPDRRGHNFDGVAPSTLITRASVKDGWIVFPDGMRYRVLVLPRFDTMTPKLLRKIRDLVVAGATIIGNAPTHSPSLVGYPACDSEVRALAHELWGKEAIRKVGKGMTVTDEGANAAGDVPSLNGASWIWSGAEDAAREAPVGVRTFSHTLSLPAGNAIRAAKMAITADNTFILKVNGEVSAMGSDFHKVQMVDISNRLHSGENRVEVTVTNEGATPNPAGLIGSLRVDLANGTVIDLPTDKTWQSEDPVKELGPWSIGPWGLTSAEPPREIYPTYETTDKVLRMLNCAPDLDEPDSTLRYAHRHLPDAEVYFIANRRNEDVTCEATFRVPDSMQPEWWNPRTGERRALARSSHVALRLAPFESGFVVFRRVPSSAPNVESKVAQAVGTIETPWTVDFDPKFGGTANVHFDKLVDWTTRPEPEIRYFSGKATYRTTFDAGDVNATALSLGVVHDIASVRLNGHDLGVAWCDPWTVRIPAGTLKAKDNALEITIANRWPNRLIGDRLLPKEKQIVKTTWNPYGPDSPLLRSGLIGPVRLMK